MAKIIIWDSNTTRAAEYAIKFAGLPIETLKVTTSKDDLQNCKLFLRHSNDNVDNIENDTCYKNAVIIEFSGGGLTSEIIKDTFPFEARTECYTDIFHVLDILEKDTYTIEDVYYILGFDPNLEKYLEPFVAANPFGTTNSGQQDLKAAKSALQSYVTDEYLIK